MIHADVDMDSLELDQENDYLITDQSDKINVLGAHFTSVHTQNDDMGRPEITNIINNNLRTFESELLSDLNNAKTLIQFNDNNLASSPTFEEDNKYFCNKFDLAIKLRKLNKKKSSGSELIWNSQHRFKKSTSSNNFRLRDSF